MNTLEKSQVKSIRVYRAEGTIKSSPREVICKSFDEAQVIFCKWGRTAPSQGYDKCDFQIIWENDSEYSGGYDLTNTGYESGDVDLRNHVSQSLKFYTGDFKPYHMSEEKYKDYIENHVDDSTKKECREMLENLEI